MTYKWKLPLYLWIGMSLIPSYIWVLWAWYSWVDRHPQYPWWLPMAVIIALTLVGSTVKLYQVGKMMDKPKWYEK